MAAGIGARGFNETNAANIVFFTHRGSDGVGLPGRSSPSRSERACCQSPKRTADVGQLMRTIGFASTPGLVRVFGFIPGVTIPAFTVSSIWMLLAMVVAVRQALDYKRTGRAVAVCVLGWLLGR